MTTPSKGYNSGMARPTEPATAGLTHPGINVLHGTKPRLRGWIPAAMVPLSLIAAFLLLSVAPTGPAMAASALFTGSMVLNCSASAALHRGRWSPRAEGILTRLDHASIFLVIAAAYTSVATMFLPSRDRAAVLIIVWTGAAVGTLARLISSHQPRWLRVATYLGLAAAPILWLQDITSRARPEVLVLLCAAGLFYLAGAVVYSVRRPDPLPAWYGFHELFHTLTVLAFTIQFAALMIGASSVEPAVAG
jgi:hemolysin III